MDGGYPRERTTWTFQQVSNDPPRATTWTIPRERFQRPRFPSSDDPPEDGFSVHERRCWNSLRTIPRERTTWTLNEGLRHLCGRSPEDGFSVSGGRCWNALGGSSARYDLDELEPCGGIPRERRRGRCGRSPWTVSRGGKGDDLVSTVSSVLIAVSPYG